MKYKKIHDLKGIKSIEFLMDYDVVNSLKIEKMMNYFINDIYEEITLVTSQRRFIDYGGNILRDNGVTQKLYDIDTSIQSIKIFFPKAECLNVEIEKYIDSLQNIKIQLMEKI